MACKHLRVSKNVRVNTYVCIVISGLKKHIFILFVSGTTKNSHYWEPLKTQ